MTLARRTRVAEAYHHVLEGRSVDLEGRHAGLLLDRGLRDSSPPAPGQATSAKAELIGRVAGVTPDELYRDAYARWRTTLERRANVEWRELAVRGTLIVGLGSEGVLETGITLQRAYGMPVIPGSALKGLARRYVQGRLMPQAGETDEERAKFAPEGPYHEVLFGHQKNAGYITYHDAWWVPGSADQATTSRAEGDRAEGPLVRDVITVHHPRYYTASAGKREAPRDIDDPNPVSFIGARGCFLVAVDGPDASWAHAAMEVLIAALGDLGAGAKTSSGYGRLAASATNGAPDGTRRVTSRPEQPAVTPIRTVVPPAQQSSDTANDNSVVPTLGDEVAGRDASVVSKLTESDTNNEEQLPTPLIPPPVTTQEDIDTAQIRKQVRAEILEVSAGKKGVKLQVQLLTKHREELSVVVSYGYAQRLPQGNAAVGYVIRVTVVEMEPQQGNEPAKVSKISS